MALLVTDVLIQAKQNNWDKEKTMTQIAHAFINDLDDRQYGWAAPYRAPGNACLAGVRTIKKRASLRTTQRSIHPSYFDYIIKDDPEKAQFYKSFFLALHALQNRPAIRWWDTQKISAGGCGSVMRAFPFGLLFHDEPEKAALWAAEHSKLTHGAPLALAASAAMARGVAHALNGETREDIIHAMIQSAGHYDEVTAHKMMRAYNYAMQAQQLLTKLGLPIKQAFKNRSFRALHEKVFHEFEGWAAHDAIAATVYVFALFSEDIRSAFYVGVHTPGDSDSIAAMSGALIGAYSGDLPDKSMMNSIEDRQRLEKTAQHINALL